jgi:hypothetical protein
MPGFSLRLAPTSHYAWFLIASCTDLFVLIFQAENPKRPTLFTHPAFPYDEYVTNFTQNLGFALFRE